MAQITPNLQLTVWNNLSDPYDSGQLANNFVKIDLHNHDGVGGGIQLNGAIAIAPDSISSVQIGANAVGSTELLGDANTPGNDANRAVESKHIKSGAIITDKIADQAITSTKLESSFLAAIRPLYIDGTDSQYSTINTAINAAYPGYQVVNGTEIYYKAAPNVVWHLRYNSSASTYKWECLGGSSIFSKSSDATEDANTNDTTWKISTQSYVSLPYAITGGIFDITYIADLKLYNANDWNSGSAEDIETNLAGSEAGALISYQWAATLGGAAFSGHAAADNFAIVDDLLSYNKLNEVAGTSRSPQISLMKTVRATRATSLSNSKIQFAQRRATHAQAGSVDFNNRTINIRPVAII